MRCGFGCLAGRGGCRLGTGANQDAQDALFPCLARGGSGIVREFSNHGVQVGRSRQAVDLATFGGQNPQRNADFLMDSGKVIKDKVEHLDAFCGAQLL